MCWDRFGATTENSVICAILIRFGDFVVLVTMTSLSLPNFVNIECEISKLAVSVNFSNGVTVPVVFHSDRSDKSYDCFFVLGGIVMTS